MLLDSWTDNTIAFGKYFYSKRVFFFFCVGDAFARFVTRTPGIGLIKIIKR